MPKQDMKSEHPKRGRALKIVVFLLLLAFYASFLVHPIALPVGDDLPRLIRNGNDIVHGNYDVLTKNVYSYTEPDHKFANHHWLSGVIYYFVDETVGWDGQVIFKIIVLLAAFSILFAAALKKADFWLVALFSIPTILILRERTFVRPEMFSYLFVAIYLYILLYAEQHPHSKKIFWLIPLQLLWVNMHLFFGVGILMIAGFLFEKYRQQKRDPSPERKQLVKKLGIVSLALVVTSLINPFGFRGALFALSINIGKDFPIRILETRSLSDFLTQSPLWSDISVGLLIPLVILGAISFIFGISKRPIFYFFALAGSAALSYMLLRALPLFGMMFLPAVSANFNGEFEALREWLNRKKPAVAPFVRITAASALIATLIYMMFFDVLTGDPKYKYWGIGLTKNSTAAAEFFNAHNIQGPIFNDADLGSYLIYYLYPKTKVFVDNRFGDAYSSTFFNIYLATLSREEKWLDLDEHLGFNAIFMYQYDKGQDLHNFLFRRANDPVWALVYGDNYNLIYLKRNEQNRELIDRFAITADNAGEKLQHLTSSPIAAEQIAAGDIMNLLNIEDQAIEVFKKVVARWPDNGSVWRGMGEMTLLYVSEPDPNLAVEYLERALVEGETTANTYGLLGLAYYRTQRLGEAKQSLEKALEIDPALPDTKELLEEVNGLLSGKTFEQIQAEKWYEEWKGEQQENYSN